MLTTTKRENQHPIIMLNEMYRVIRNMIIPIALYTIQELRNGSESQPYWVYVVTVILSLCICLKIFLSWKCNTFMIEGKELDLKSGVFTKTDKIIPLHKISTIDTHQDWLYRLLGVVKVEIRTSDSDQRSDATISLSERKARMLELLLKEGVSGKVESEAHPTEMKRVISNKELFVMSLSSTNWMLGVPIIATILQFLTPESPSTPGEATMKVISNQQFWSNVSIGKLTLQLILAWVIFLALSWIVSLIIVQIKYKGWTVSRNTNHLLIHFGMFEKKKVQIQVDKIQSIRIKEQWLNRLLGYGAVWIDCVGYQGENKIKILVPAIKLSELSQVLHQILPEFSLQDELQSLSPNAKNLYTVPFVTGALLLIGIASIFYLPCLIALPLLWAVYRYRLYIYKEARWGIHENQLVLSNPGLTKTTVYVLRKAVESVMVTQDFLHRKCKIKRVDIDIDSPSRSKEYVINGIEDTDVQLMINWYKNVKMSR
ncbi:PH domain-containing protein [Brevibacillus sp. NPDC058079]|uniref:PH domain-containing protein n=1 Tax=Brevibacillus sp. NPDC058079 TaxID=3346330 RepID=UPI0036DFBF05